MRAAFVFLAIAPVLAQPQDARPRVDRIFSRFDSASSPGCSVGVSIKEEPVLRAAYGMADLEHDVRLTPETVFEPGSVTKQFTAAATLLLAQDGKISLDDPVRKYIPELPDYGNPITIRHLLNHTSGLRDWGSIAAIEGWPRTTRVHTHAHVLEIVARQRALNYTPGADYSYTNTGYNLLAILVGRVSGKSLAEFTKERIFLPLGMTSTEWRDDFRRIVKRRAVAYAPSGAGFRMDMPFEDVHGNGGLLTTIDDLLRWNRNFVDPKVGGRALVGAQLRQGRLNDGRTIAYASGLMVLHWRGFDEVSHSGSTAGYSAWLGRYPGLDLSVAVLCNVTANATQLGHAVADVYLPAGDREVSQQLIAVPPGTYRSNRDHSVLTVGENGKMSMPAGARIEIEGRQLRRITETETVTYEKVEPWHPSAEELAALAGEYVSDEAEVTFTVAIESGGLVIRRRPDARFALTPVYRDGFVSQLGSIRFRRNASGGVSEMSLGESRVWDLRFRRVK